MKILITNNNIDFFKAYTPDLEIRPATKNTSVIHCTEELFNELHAYVKDMGCNPHSVMAW